MCESLGSHLYSSEKSHPPVPAPHPSLSRGSDETHNYLTGRQQYCPHCETLSSRPVRRRLSLSSPGASCCWLLCSALFLQPLHGPGFWVPPTFSMSVSRSWLSILCSPPRIPQYITSVTWNFLPHIPDSSPETPQSLVQATNSPFSSDFQVVPNWLTFPFLFKSSPCLHITYPQQIALSLSNRWLVWFEHLQLLAPLTYKIIYV